ncbi:Uncharacterized ABC transporter ATP-binding protein YbhF [Actinomyces bovis]|uniref:Uncharacterized ABC transporter ATP-binding protein YbhF n=1 Tax=Actinomyces bovis TaxID=1658 RepID=A0ABY1VQ09_9ACTO|nr:ABC transporter ATP-binding protein [Actinomyces bovis]SPT54206.1 Uncharacterized ABC transporter ATP-binding protein YbhF [Actinomyces bovis]VEG56543.1 Uncharacterized ABC transporter ATP-binding protein YbhF [Actinomyces israelii]
MKAPSFECRRLTKVFDGFILGPVDADFPKGQVTGIFGPNGAGKSTLVSLLTGTLKKDSGEVANIGQFTCGGVFEQLFLLPHTRVIDQLEGLRRALKRSPGLLDNVIDECNLTPYLNHRVVKLSTGNKQRLALALSLIQDPDVFIFDEPLNGLDPDGIEWLNSRVKALALNQKAIIFATHLLAEAEAIVDRCLFLMEGQVIYQGNLDSIIESMEDLDRYICLESSELTEGSSGQDVVYRGKRWVYVYEPSGVSGRPEGLSLAEIMENNLHRVSLTELYHLKTHNFRVSGGSSE